MRIIAYKRIPVKSSQHRDALEPRTPRQIIGVQPYENTAAAEVAGILRSQIATSSLQLTDPKNDFLNRSRSRVRLGFPQQYRAKPQRAASSAVTGGSRIAGGAQVEEAEGRRQKAEGRRQKEPAFNHTRSGLKNTPSPRGSGERVGVRGKAPSIFIGKNKTLALPPHPIPLPQLRERGFLRWVLITPGAFRAGDPVRPGADVREQFRDGRPA